MSIYSKIKTYHALGLNNICRVALYRIGLKTGLHPVLKLKAKAPSGSFYKKNNRKSSSKLVARKSWQRGNFNYFGKNVKISNEPPAWRANLLENSKEINPNSWWKISDFSNEVGDIKIVWEPSRFDWLIAMAQRAALGDENELRRLNNWLKNWSQENQPYLGPNWKCGQESSIRVLHMILACEILGQVETANDALLQLIKLHLERIAPTISYAIGQANNHGTSEAAALFIGGHFLELNGDIKEGSKWRALGHKWLENRAVTLIAKDGTFSQYSVNYHRMMLDTYSFAEFWRREHDLTEFSVKCLSRLKAATQWLRQMTNKETGHTPIIGANDGTCILSLSQSDYRDYRPCVQLASALFENKRAYNAQGEFNQPLYWLGIKLPSENFGELKSHSFDDGGIHVLRKENVTAYLRYPRFKFRPSQSDLLHCDLWVDKINLLRDAGSYSYNTDSALMQYFNGTQGHNTVQFDGLEQMPKISRFLYRDWIKSQEVAKVNTIASIVHARAAYKNNRGHYHNRSIELSGDMLVVEDILSGDFQEACLRWRLAPFKWKMKNNMIYSKDFCLEFQCEDLNIIPSLIDGEQSEYYLHKNTIPVIEIKLHKPCKIRTSLSF